MRSRLPPEEAKEFAITSAARLARLIQMNAPDVVVGAEWALLWQRMTAAYGDELLGRSLENQKEVDRFIEDDDHKN